MRDEHAQQAELGTGQHYHAVVRIDQVAMLQVEHPARETRTAHRQRLQVGRQRLGPAQHVADARQQLARFERLGQVVVGAHFQAEHAVDRLGARGQHDHRRVRARPQVATQGQAILARQVEVEHDQVHVFAVQQLAHGGAVCGRAHLVAGAAELLGQQGADVVVVVDDQQSMHRVFSLHVAIIPCRQLNRIRGNAYQCIQP